MAPQLAVAPGGTIHVRFFQTLNELDPMVLNLSWLAKSCYILLGGMVSSPHLVDYTPYPPVKNNM